MAVQFIAPGTLEAEVLEQSIIWPGFVFPRVLPTWAVLGVLSDMPGINPGESTLFDTFQSVINAIPDETLRRIVRGKFTATDQWHRDSALVEEMRQRIGMSEEQLESLWLQGEDLVAADAAMGG